VGVRVPAGRRRGIGQVVNSGGVLDLPEAGEQVDRVRSGVRSSGAWSAGPIASRS
jgi:hypothetical protein